MGAWKLFIQKPKHTLDWKCFLSVVFSLKEIPRIFLKIDFKSKFKHPISKNSHKQIRDWENWNFHLPYEYYNFQLKDHFDRLIWKRLRRFWDLTSLSSQLDGLIQKVKKKSSQIFPQ